VCGLVGVWDPTLTLPARAQLVERLTDMLRHRGPDGQGLWADPHAPIALGHRRLAIQGLGTQGAQPMRHPGGGVLSWNGELFDALPLRRRLEADGAVFSGTSDTEILLHALGRFGLPEALSHLDGQYAIAWLDGGTLWLARDPFGIRPLYYATLGDKLAFASEQKALLPLPWIDRAPDENALWRYLVLGRTDDLSGTTMLRALHQLPAGHFARWDGTRLEVRRFFRVSARLTAVGVHELRAGLEAAVTSQLVSDVPIGATVSGGLDSSTVTLLADRARDHARPLHLFAFHDARAEADERVYQQAVLERVGAPKELHWVSSTPAAFADGFDRYVHHQEEPYGDLSSYAEYCLAQAAATAGVKVLLGGLGGDEAFAGYPAFLGPLLLDALAERDFSTARTLLRVTGQVLPGAHATRTLVSAVYTLLPARARHLVTALRAAAHSRLSLGAAARVGRGSLLGWHPHDALDESRSTTASALRGALESWCVPRYLLHSDRMTLAWGVEGRVPLLAPRLVSAALALPAALRVDELGLKAGLRLAARDVLPEVVYRRAWKQGFHAPLGPYVAAVDERLHAGAREVARRLDEKLDWAQLSPTMRWRWGALGNYLHWVNDR